MATSAIASKKQTARKSTIESPSVDVEADEEEYGNPLAENEPTDFQENGGQLAEYEVGYDEKFSSSQIFGKLETEASVSLSRATH